MNYSILFVHLLRVNDLDSPMGVVDVPLSFSWKLDSKVWGAEQSAYQILVSTNEVLLQHNEATGKIM